MGIRDRLRRLERGFRDRGANLEEVNVDFKRLVQDAKAKLYGKSVDEDQ
jgi:hypothetical protein